MDFLRFEQTHTPPATHGALDFAELERLGLSAESVLDFSVNSNPFGPSPAVRAAVAATPLDRYPDRESLSLRRALAERLKILPQQIVIGNGTAELIWLTAFASLKAGDEVLILGPTFGEYQRAVDLMAATSQHWNALPAAGFAFDVPEITRILDSVQFRAVFLCNPNNPTGQVLPNAAIYAWAEAHPQTLFIVDEAYLAFVPGMESVLSTGRANLLVLRSMTKDYALAGLRLGYAAGDERLIQALTSVRPAWNVNALAQAAGMATLTDEAHQQATLAQLQQEKHFLLNGLRDLGFTPVTSQAQFFLVPVPAGNATVFRQSLLPQGILVRDCASFGLPNHIRISPRTRDENLRLLEALKHVRPV
ncbi:MAG: histidinol-phosphate transaminase [Chloroflexi bacterium]|nr:histidinol-phosphate transaminase [Chloroflexota bacterium]